MPDPPQLTPIYQIKRHVVDYYRDDLLSRIHLKPQLESIWSAKSEIKVKCFDEEFLAEHEEWSQRDKLLVGGLVHLIFSATYEWKCCIIVVGVKSLHQMLALYCTTYFCKYSK